MNYPFRLLLLMLYCFSVSVSAFAQKKNSPPPTAPIIVGAMKKVMWHGELFPTIEPDTLKNQTHLYGMGPMSYLKGETLIMDGVGYTSQVANDSEMKVTQTLHFSAPFYGYAHISKWVERPIPDSVDNLTKLERYLDRITKKYPRPFFFKIGCRIRDAEIHIVNLPDGTKVSSPQEAHQGLRHYKLTEYPVEMLGFFSKEHQAIFTHHDTWLHIHLITTDRSKMGHLEQVEIRHGTAKLFLPEIRS